MLFDIFICLLAAVVLCLYVYLIVEVCGVAKKQKRSALLWTLISIFFSPLFALVFLTCFEFNRAIRETD